MKTLNQINKESQKIQSSAVNSIGSVLKASLIAAIVLFNIVSGKSQTKKGPQLLFGIENFSSANSHGAFYSPMLSFRLGRNTIGAGLPIQKRSMQGGAFRISYERNLTGERVSYRRTEFIAERDIFQINFVSYAQYNKPLPLSFEAANDETAKSNSESYNWNNKKLCTFEAGIGFQLQLNVSEDIGIKSTVAASAFYHPDHVSTMYLDKVGPGLFLGIGLNVRIK